MPRKWGSRAGAPKRAGHRALRAQHSAPSPPLGQLLPAPPSQTTPMQPAAACLRRRPRSTSRAEVCLLMDPRDFSATISLPSASWDALASLWSLQQQDSCNTCTQLSGIEGAQ